MMPSPPLSPRPSRLLRTHALLRSQKARFLLVGAWNTLFGYLAFVAVYFLFGRVLPMLAVLVAAYVLSMVHAFLTQRTLVFNAASGAIWRQLAKFCIANTAVFSANALFLPITVSLTGASPVVVQAAFVALSTVATYFLHKHFSFAR